MDDISTNTPLAPEATQIEGVETPNPIHVEPKIEPARVEPEKAKSTTREALEAAAAKVEASEKTSAAREAKEAKAEIAEKTPDPKAPVVDADKTAKPDAKPVAKTPTDNDAPARFSDDAKTAWATAPDAVKAETHRALRELESGVAKYKEAAEAYEPLRKFADIAKANETTIPEALERYVNIDKGLVSKDVNEKARSIELVLEAAGTNPSEYAAWVQGGGKAQTPQSDPVISELRQQVQALQQQLGQVSSSVQSQQQQELASQIEQWKADKPLVETLASEISHYYENDGLSLDDAYSKAKQEFEDKARRAGFISAQQAVPPENVAQTQRVQKSIAGSPGSGSYPAASQPSNSIAESIRRAAARVT